MTDKCRCRYQYGEVKHPNTLKGMFKLIEYVPVCDSDELFLLGNMSQLRCLFSLSSSFSSNVS